MRKLSSRSTLFMKPFMAILSLGFIIASCSDQSISTNESSPLSEIGDNPEFSMMKTDMEYSFGGPVFDIAALPNGNILVADFNVVKEIGKKGVKVVQTLPMVEGPGADTDGDGVGEIESTFVNGLEPIGGGNFFATRSGLDLALGAALFRVSPGNYRLTGGIESFTLGDWPDGDPGQVPDWKDMGCEDGYNFSVGPQTNPYNLTALSGSEVLIADAAANSLLYAKTNGEIEVVATFGPVVDPDSNEPIVLFQVGENMDIDCFTEPVPTAVAVGPDEEYYVAELTGSAPANFGGQPTPDGLASIWRIESYSRNIECPSDKCKKVVTGLNSAIDIEFGPDGYLYVVEYEQNGFLATVAPDLNIPVVGGTVKKCDVMTDSCEIIEGGDGTLFLPGAITFDKWDNLWLVDNVFEPTIRQVSINQTP